MVKLDIIEVDGEVRMACYVDGHWVEEVDISSQFTIKQAKQYLLNKYRR